jgi:DNA primase
MKYCRNGVKQSGNGWVALCPSHDDKSQSLSIGIGDDGKALMHCHANCEYVQVVQDLGLSEREQNEQRKIVATYNYTDENGNILYQAVRYEGKKFLVRRPDGNGGFIWNLNNTERVIYRLPEIVQAKEKKSFVVFCEGEKDADNIREKLDFPATTIAQGVGSWKEDFADYFVGLHVIVLPDNDEAGKGFAEKVANSIYGKAQSVTIVNLPDLPYKGDVSDWIEQGGNRDKFIELVNNTPEYEFKEVMDSKVNNAESNGNNLLIMKSAAEWIEVAKTKPIPKMLFGELWFESEICILFADTNAGKSILAVQIADSITTGKPTNHFSLEVEPQKVLYFDFELIEQQFGQRYAENVGGYLANEYNFSKDFIRVSLNPDANLSVNSNFEDSLEMAIESAVVQTGIKILILDNITFLKSNNETAKDALPLMKRLKALKARNGLSILALAHTPKRDLSREITQNDLAGSKMLINFCDSAFSIGKSCKDESVRYIKQIKERNTGKIYGTENVAVCEVSKENNFLSFRFFSFGDEKEHLKSKDKKDKQEEIERAKELKSDGKSQRQIASVMGISVGKVNGLLKEVDDLISSEIEDVQIVHPLFDSDGLNSMNKAEVREKQSPAVKPVRIDKFEDFDLKEPNEVMPLEN